MKKNIHTNKKITTIVNIVLDKSGSMSTCKAGTIEGFNSYIRKLQEEKGKFLVSLTLFDTAVEKRCSLVPVKEVTLLTNDNYRPEGSTALWDASVDSIEECYEHVKRMEDKPAVLSVILTDGEENSSKKHDRDCMKELVDKLTAEGNWSFIYLGANQDAWGNAQVVGMAMGNTANFQSTNAGMTRSFNAMYSASADLSADANMGRGLSSVNLLANLKDKDNELT